MKSVHSTHPRPNRGPRLTIGLGLIAVALVANAAAAGPTKTFEPGETLRAEDLNERFAAVEAAAEAAAKAAAEAATIPAGTIVPYGGSSVPDGWLPCDGTELDSTKPEYAELFAAIGVAHGGSATSGMFNLPDLRGRFLRGWDNGAGVDPDAATRVAAAAGANEGDAVGSVQGDMVGAHNHAALQQSPVNFYAGNLGSGFSQIVPGLTGSTGGSETRPTNVAVSYIIKL